MEAHNQMAFSDTKRAIRCPIEELAEVEVVFNIMAGERTMDQFANTLGTEGREKVIVEVRNWPAAEYGEDPFGPDAPMAFRYWAAAHGMQQAVREYVSDPN